MARKKTASRVVRAIADTMWERDRLQMRAVDALLPTGAPSRRRRRTSRHSRDAKGRR
jgi:hypothetical protein